MLTIKLKENNLRALKPSWCGIDDSSYRLNFDRGKKKKIHHHSSKEHVKISTIAKFGREML